MRQIDREKLKRAMAARHMTAEDLSVQLAERGYFVHARVVQKWMNKGLQPPADRVGLIEQVLNFSVSKDLRPRRSFGGSLAIDQSFPA